MKIVIADTPETQVQNHENEFNIMKKGLGNDVEIVVHDYDQNNLEAFYEVMEDADALLTAYIKMDKAAIDRSKKLKIISVSATGYDNVDLAFASERNIGVCAIGEYCTKDVAEFTIALLLGLTKNLKQHTVNIEKENVWEYDGAVPNQRVDTMTLGIVGLGKIGKDVARKAKAIGMKVIAYDPFIDDSDFHLLDVEKCEDVSTLLAQADVVSNHMNLNETNKQFFDIDKFSKMRKQPYFINTGRASCVVESDLLRALDEGLIKGAALDVIANETNKQNLVNHPLINRDNVIITPHVAFYTTDAMEDLQRFSCQNIVYYLSDQKEKVFKLVN